MSEDKILNTINEEIVKLTPDNYDEIVSKTQFVKQDNIIMFKPKKKTGKRLLALAATFAIIVCAVFAFYAPNNRIDSVIDIDVNPSIEISTNAKDKIINVDCLNEDANVILDGMDLKGVNLNIGINAIIGSMLKNGYITDTHNAVLVSVSNNDETKQASLLKQVSEDIDSALSERKVEGAVLSQTLTHEDRIQALANEYGISEGKALLIDYICTENKTADYEVLADLSISELAFMVETSQNNQNTSNENKEDKIAISGAVDKSQYIGEKKAKEIAFADANLSENRVSDISVEVDRDDGILVYEVSFDCDGFEYEYEINAFDGTIVEKQREFDEDYYNQNNVDSSDVINDTYITKDAAKSAALSHAKLDESNIVKYKIELKKDGKTVFYKIEFESGKTKYKYKIDAVDGSIIESKKDGDDEVETSENSILGVNYISRSDAKAKALNHAGLKESDISKYEIHLDMDDGAVLYEIEFKSGKTEYEYKINALNGEIVEAENDSKEEQNTTTTTEKETNNSADETSDSNRKYISRDQAKAAVLNHAGLKESDISGYRIHMDIDDGKMIYEIEFNCNRTEYEYEVNAKDGTIISSDKETDD